MEQLVVMVLQILAPVIAAGIVGLIWKQIGATGMKKVESELSAKKEYVLIAVRLVEQAYKDLRGEEKLNAAIKWVTAILNEKGIRFTEAELKGLIESTVRQMKDEFGSEWANTKERENKLETAQDQLVKHLNARNVQLDTTISATDIQSLTPSIVDSLVNELKKKNF